MTVPTPGVLAKEDLLRVEDEFGVGEEQVRRDHLISHVLSAVSTLGVDDVMFLGGTALSRTWLPGLRLSEDIDLIALGRRPDVADLIEAAVARALRRGFGEVSFSPHMRSAKHPQPSVMAVAGLKVQVQLLAATGYPAWPSTVSQIVQRYRDAPSAQLRVLTRPAAAAAKLAAWHDRHAARDLYDMWAMIGQGMISGEAANLFATFGPLRRTAAVSFDEVPTPAQWESALAHQCILHVGARQAAEEVRAAWAAA
ncbi:MAG: nucleotidyl transferase AbiEii/AbiGii toxin family protein [Acidipropionibacterium acidipropionici]|jgi:predicted nucleotidyltransferase component of viral defense system|uniref:nucleotidyl transferase AbiEii/AbiGii toxin family protein n=1 Tax=Acidipropionibacterium acidipropionici TaxID=1748 RepID=UPI002F35CEA2